MSAENNTVLKQSGNGASAHQTRSHEDHDPIADDERCPEPRILIVDDDPALLLLMSGALEGAGFVVAPTANGAEAVAQCREFQPDLVLLDIDMPEMDGLSACAKIRRATDGRDFPIVMVTGLDDEMSIHRAFEAGATDFMLKPINWPLFQHRVSGFLAAGKTSVELEASHQTINMLKRAAPDLVLIVARNGAILEHFRCRTTDSNPDPACPIETLEDLWPSEIVQVMRQRIRSVLKARQSASYEFELNSETGNRLFDARFLIDGREHVLVTVQDITDIRASQTEVYRLAYWDPVTGLPNRHLFEKTAETCIAEASLRGRGLAMVYLSFDKLDEINAALNRTEVQEALQNIAVRLIRSVRDSDHVAQLDQRTDALHVARLSGSRFAVLLTDISSHEYVVSVGERILAAFRDPIACGNQSIDLGPSLGISLFPKDGRDVAALMAASATAAQEASATGDDAVHFSSDTVRTRALDGLDLGSELRHAMEQDQLQLHYQPRVNINTGDVVGVEALLRWQHPLRGFVPVDELLPLAKATGLIEPIGHWVLNTACQHACAWHEQGWPQLHVSINLSRQEFSRSDLLERIAEVLDRTGLEPACLEIELTEGALMRTQQAVANLKRLKDLGIGLVLDDFGTGHSSLTYLTQFTIDSLKIDHSFVHGLPDNADDVTICEVIIGMAHKLGFKAVAEGVETMEQLEFLRRQGCDEMQGFLISKPLPQQELEAYLRRLRPQAPEK